ncbi:MAG: hypothetical protein ACRDY2_01785 [Acidimicrobiales bacterium]
MDLDAQDRCCWSFLEFFQTRRDTGALKGIVGIELGGSHHQ